jgi:hypothetical protein
LSICKAFVLAIALMITLGGCCGHPSAAGDPGKTVDDDPATDSLVDIAAEFRSLRTIKGHFEGGTWDDDLDKWMGRKHQLMIQLGSRLGTGEYSEAQIIQLLAPPDLTAREGDALFDLVGSLAEFEEPTTGPYDLLIYYWRGSHDFLYFASRGQTIISSGWWYAGD